MKTFDVAIAGAGLIGGSISLELARAGLRVGLFDRQEPGKEASWASAGILSPAPENPGMIATVPLGKASMALYPEFVALVEELSGQKTGYRTNGTLEVITSRHAREELSTIIALHHGLGLQAEPLSASDARELEPSLREDIEAAVLRPQEASVDNRLLTGAILESARKCGVEIFSGARVESVLREGDSCRGLLVNGEKVSAAHTVIAAGSFSAQIAGVEHYAPVRPAKGQMISLVCPETKIERVLWSDEIYLVPRTDGRILAGATVEYAGFDKALTAGGQRKLFSAAIDLVPAFERARVEETWAGLRPDSTDHLPILGPTDLQGLVIATGHFRSGVLLTPVTAKLVREYITLGSVATDWERFSPMRFAQARQQSRARAN
ncbi:MAG: glycine oxidase ThiO [Acidobacteria bacterium]|nr:glycine oxidase ThiO [Acidobacteriota bacterium]MBS1867284.1 glycine oxidase ThiO [Acidobacteriota bacterium]